MNSFTRIAENALSKTNLLRVRLKVDPLNKIGKDFREYDGYEGYILQERNKKYDILLDDFATKIMNVPMVIVDIQKIDDDQFDKLKIAGLKFLKDIGKFTYGLSTQIAEAPDLEFFDQYLKGAGLSDIDLKDIYRDALFGESEPDIIGEGIKDAAASAGRGIANAAGKVASVGKYAVPGYMANKVIAPRLNKATNWLTSTPDLEGNASRDKKLTPEEQKLQSEYFKTLSQDETSKGPLIAYRVGHDIKPEAFKIKFPAELQLSLQKYTIINFSPHHVTFEYFPDQRQYDKWRDSGLIHWWAPAATSKAWIYVITGTGASISIKPVQYSQLSTQLPGFDTSTTTTWTPFIRELVQVSSDSNWDTRFVIAFNAHPLKYIRPITAGAKI
mgnify:CR=1 FL=1